MQSKIVRRPMQGLVRRELLVVLGRSDDVEGHLDLEQAFVQVHWGTVWVKSGVRRNHVVLGGADGPFRPVGVLHIWGHKVPFYIQLFSH